MSLPAAWRRALIAPFLLLAIAGCQTPLPSRPPVAPVTAPAPVAAHSPVTAEPANLGPHKQALVAYVDSGGYEAGLAQVAAEARQWIAARAARGGKLAVVFDLDETILSNLRHMRAMDFGYVPALWDRWVEEGDAEPIAPVVEVYRTARAAGVDVFFVTGRKGTDRPGTEKNLRAAGLGDFAELLCKPVDFAGDTAAFKTAMRRRITAEGYTIIANLGDQDSDLRGGYAERTFKLPNPFYVIP